MNPKKGLEMDLERLKLEFNPYSLIGWESGCPSQFDHKCFLGNQKTNDLKSSLSACLGKNKNKNREGMRNSIDVRDAIQEP